jgi:hypothetical protein
LPFGLCSGILAADTPTGAGDMDRTLDLDAKLAILMSLAGADREGFPGRDRASRCRRGSATPTTSVRSAR